MTPLQTWTIEKWDGLSGPVEGPDTEPRVVIDLEGAVERVAKKIYDVQSAQREYPHDEWDELHEDYKLGYRTEARETFGLLTKQAPS